MQLHNAAPGVQDGRPVVYFAICAYPARPLTATRVYLLCEFGLFMRHDPQGCPVLRWPDDDFRQSWAIVD